VFSSMPGPCLAELPHSDPTFYEDFERLDRLVAELGGAFERPSPSYGWPHWAR
jgi:hypothetical protein